MAVRAGRQAGRQAGRERGRVRVKCVGAQKDAAHARTDRARVVKKVLVKTWFKANDDANSCRVVQALMSYILLSLLTSSMLKCS